MLLKTLFLLLIIPNYLALQGGYYWRDYHGIIPEDAITAGKDINGEDVYIGQAYVKNGGLLVAEISPNSKEVLTPFHDVGKITKCVKILCGHQEDFFWLLTNSTDLHFDLLGLRPVIGGHEDDGGVLNIGRISFGGSTRVGKVNAFDVGNSDFLWVSNGKAASAKSYEVLTYDEQPRRDDCKEERVGNQLGSAVLLAILDALDKNE